MGGGKTGGKIYEGNSINDMQKNEDIVLRRDGKQTIVTKRIFVA